jgi:adenosylcobinamide kinase/adenosylcobinamide-phosphate guanylyltransferase
MPDRGRLTLILGGARAGKSSYAEACAKDVERVVFIATAEALDDDMTARIARHRTERPAHWSTVEAPLDLSGAIAGAHPDAALIIDCLTLWTSNALFAHPERSADEVTAAVAAGTADWLAAAARHRGSIFVVSNEVGLGIVPENALSRQYRDLLGRVNQQVAAAADDVVLVVAGIPVSIKRSSPES